VAARKVKWRYGPVLLKRPNPNALEIEFVAVLQDTEKVQVDFVLTDAAGETVGNVVEWTTDGAVGDRGLPVVTIEKDAVSGATFVVAGETGSSVVTATEVDPVDNVGVTSSITFDVVASNAVTLQITVGTPVLK
jgi:hypothetical protein